jgi:hypothetical protein
MSAPERRDPEKPSFQTAFVRWWDEAVGEPSPHPPAPALLALRRGELAEAEAETVRAHLVGCRECLERYRSPAAFTPPPANADFELAAFHRGLEAQLRQEARPVGGRSAPWLRALAAGLGVAVLGLAVWNHLQGQRLAELARPVANAPILDLPQGGSRSEEEGTVVVVPAGGFHLVLTPDVDETFAQYRLRLRVAGGAATVLDGLRRDPADGTLTLWLPPGALPPATEVELELLGIADGREIPVLAQRLRSAPPR